MSKIIKTLLYFITLGIVTSVSMLACRTIKPEVKGAWYENISEVPSSSWKLVKASDAYWVAEDSIERATVLLDGSPAVELSQQELRAFTRENLKETNIKNAYMVRGVSYGRPTFALLQTTPDGDMIHVHQGSAHPEILYPGAWNEPLMPRPMIILASRKPAHVYFTAEQGGDRVFRGWAGSKGCRWFQGQDTNK